jgi:DNA modification methylase
MPCENTPGQAGLDIKPGRIYQGDCIQFMRTLTGRLQVNLIIADPPYNIGYEYDVYKDNKPDAEYLSWSEQWIQTAAELLSPDGAIWIAIGDEYAAEIKWLAQRRIGLHLRNWVIWYYTFGVQCQDKFSRSHTHLLYFVKDAKRYKFRDEAIRVPSARRLVYKDARSHPAGRVPDNTWILRPHDLPHGFNADEDTWYFPRVAGTFKERARFMQCQLPEKLLARIILACSDPGDLVFDPFAGSGSSLIVAKKLGRQYLGCELSANYAQWANRRLNQVDVGDPLEGPADPLLSAPPTVARNQLDSLSPEDRERLARGVARCFTQLGKEYSIDRVLADPILNARYLDACSQAKLPGRPLLWNLTLLNLRKAGKLKTTASYSGRADSKDVERVLHGAEIALRTMLDQGFPSVDYILCDPAAAIRFDDYARRLAPGYKVWHYRWAALRLRKRAKKIREQASQLPSFLNVPATETHELEAPICDDIPSKPGLYFLWLQPGANKSLVPLYIGQTTNLLETVRQLIEVADVLSALCKRPGKILVSWYCPNPPLAQSQLTVLRYKLVWQCEPIPEWNYLAVCDLHRDDRCRINNRCNLD